MLCFTFYNEQELYKQLCSTTILSSYVNFLYSDLLIVTYYYLV